MPKSSHFSSITSIANKNNDSQVNSSGGSLYFKRAITLTSKRKPSHNTLAATNASVFLSTQQTRKPKEANIQERPTTAATSTKRAQPSKRIMAITKGRGVAIEIGICIFDVGSGECIVSQVGFSQDDRINSLFNAYNISWQTRRHLLEHYKRSTSTIHKRYSYLCMLQTTPVKQTT